MEVLALVDLIHDVQQRPSKLSSFFTEPNQLMSSNNLIFKIIPKVQMYKYIIVVIHIAVQHLSNCPAIPPVRITLILAQMNSHKADYSRVSNPYRHRLIHMLQSCQLRSCQQLIRCFGSKFLIRFNGWNTLQANFGNNTVPSLPPRFVN